VSTAVLSYALGLRHALDADHISAIDLMTRRLIAAGQRPVTVGMFFSLGHSTVVIATSLVVAGTAAAVSSKFDSFERIGGIIGTSISAAFLLLLGIMNIYILYKLIVQMKKLIASEVGTEHEEFKIQGGGCLFPILQKLFKLIDRPWKMYPLGVLFGLGFDTSSEIAILGISSIQATKGTSIWLILIFPLLFTAGMCLLDTTDGALMMTLYTSTQLARDPVAICYYSIVLTVITVIVATVIGTVQFLNLILNVAEPNGRFWDGVEKLGDSWDIVGMSGSLKFSAYTHFKQEEPSAVPSFCLEASVCFYISLGDGASTRRELGMLISLRCHKAPIIILQARKRSRLEYRRHQNDPRHSTLLWNL
jgi:high-affinity nickel-transport protein